MKQRYLVLVGSNLTATRKEHVTEREAMLEVVGRLSGTGAYDITTRFTLKFGADRLDQVAKAWPLTDERHAAYKRIAHESSVKFRRAARQSIRAQEASGQDQLWQEAA